MDSNYSNLKISKVTTSIYRTFIKNIYDETYTLEGNTLESKVTVFYDGLKIGGTNYEIEFFGPLKRDVEIIISDYSSETDGFATVGYGATNANDASSIFTLTCFEDKYLFMGDARFTDSDLEDRDYSEWDFFNSLTRTEKEKFAEVDVLMLPHHGSKYSTCDELLDLVLPRFVVVSAGVDNKYGHPHSEVLERLTDVRSLENDYLLRTDEMGDVVFSNVNGELSYYIEKQGTEAKMSISFRMLTAIIAVSIIMLIFAIRPVRLKKRRYSIDKRW